MSVIAPPALRPESEPLVGNYFIAAYPPFSSWQPEQTPALLDALNQPAPAGTRFAAWRADPLIPGTAVASLHHPSGDLLKYSKGSTTKQEPLIDEVAILRFGCAYPYPERPGQRLIYRNLEAAMSNAVAGQPRLRFVSLIDAMKVRMPDDFLNCRDRYWADPDHLSAAGELRFGRRLPADFLDARWARSDFAGDDLRHGGRQHP